MPQAESRPVYRHNQVEASTQWMVSHGLNTFTPYCTVWVSIDGVNTVIIPKEIRILDMNTCKISFSSARAGVAIIN